MNSGEILKVSVENVRSLTNNSLLIIRDIDTILSKKGFSTLFGNTIGTEISKNINQSYNQSSALFPQFISRFYLSNEELKNNEVKQVLCVNIQFYHPDVEALVPVIIGGVFEFDSPVKDIKSVIQHWWLKYAVFEYEKDEPIVFNGKKFVCNPFEEGDTNVIFWGRELHELNSESDIVNEVTSKLLDIYSKENILNNY
ncbi:hypothetical protein Q3A90_15165 [Priestia megaterium]|uniref:hypothetical protein n=1 Tax=Priestia megaterium TaxID=1404 RepID=UPI002675B1D3|nr:hypothetical protein [Priestia megaterium]WKU21117.1 hypothetical protein Q3A90_15165 [Priestia megaterium]